MFNPNRTLIEAFIAHTIDRYRVAFPNGNPDHDNVLDQAAHTALETLLGCDCAYHDLEHTLLVTDVGQTILRGRLISQGDVSAEQWLHAVIAMLFHDIGYVRGLLREDEADSLVIDADGRVAYKRAITQMAAGAAVSSLWSNQIRGTLRRLLED